MLRRCSREKFFILKVFLSLVFIFFLHFWRLSFPPEVVFDEVHFGLYATKYLSHQYYFDIHPPLGKLLLAFAGFLGKIKPGFDFTFNSDYGDFNFVAFRCLPALFGSFFIILIYFFVKEIGFSQRVAFLSAFFLLFDNALAVQSRFILLDIILLFFIFLSFYLYVANRKHPPLSFTWYIFNILTGLSLGAAISIKWTGFGILAIVWFLSIFEDKIFSPFRKESLIKIGLLFGLPLLLYFLIFAIHFYLLPLPCTSNCGAILNSFLEKTDSTNSFRSDFNNPPTEGLISKFVKTNKLMLLSNLDSTTIYPYQSDWYSWPFMIRPVNYFGETQNGKTSYIYLLGNPIVWWLGIIGILGYFYLIAKNYFLKFKLNLPKTFYSSGCYLLVLGYLVYFLPFASIERYMLIYHYLPALVFSTILFSVFFEGILEMLFGSENNKDLLFSNKKANILFFGLLILVFISFLFFSPLTYGFPLTEKGFKIRMWLDTWSL